MTIQTFARKMFFFFLFIILTSLNYSCASSKSHLHDFDMNFFKSESSDTLNTSQNDIEEDDFPEEGFDEFLEEDEGSDDDKKELKHMVNDPLEPFNRAMFTFNDKFYYWVFKPVASGYRGTINKTGRVAVRRFFSNITTPVRFINCVLQLKFKPAGIELERFVINTTVGLAGFMDPAQKLNLYKQDEDFGQTLGYYGVGHGFYLNLPFLGPLTLRDTIGVPVDLYLNPVNHFPFISSTGKFILHGSKTVNETSLNITLYDDIVKTAFDPYVFMKDAYYQIRERQIQE